MTQPYQLTNGNCILRISDGASIPKDTGNCDYIAYQNWLAAGNTPDPAPAPPNPLPALAQAALTKSDVTVIRCYSAGVAVPSANQTYRNALRAIVNGTDTTSTVLPTEPPIPTGI